MELMNKIKKILPVSFDVPEEKINDIFQELYEKYPEGEDPWGLNLEKAKKTVETFYLVLIQLAIYSWCKSRCFS